MSYFSKPNGQPNFDASHMLMMHDMLRREFALMPGVVGRVAAGDHDRTQIVGDHIKNVSSVLHHHHVPTFACPIRSLTTFGLSPAFNALVA